MFGALGITREQLFGDVYSSWLRDIFEKPSEETKQLFTDMVESGFATERQIVLRRQRLGVNTIRSLAGLLHRSPLTRLVLSGNALRDAGGEVVARLVGELPQLTHLDLGTTGVGAAGAAALGVALAQHRKLAVLILDSQAGDPYANQITAEGAAALLEGCVRCHSLRTLDLSGNAFAGEEGERRAAAARGGGGDPRGGGGGGGKPPGAPTEPGAGDPAALRAPVELLEELLRHSALDKLRLRNVGLRGPGALRLLAALHDNFALTVLDLSDNALPAEVGDALGGLLMERTSVKNQLALRGLFLNGNHFFPMAGGGEARAGSSAPTSQRSLLEEEFVSTAARSVGFAGALLPTPPRRIAPMLLLAALSHDRMLTTLELDRCGVELHAVRTLCRALLNNTALQCLSLRENDICATAAVDLGRVLCHHHSLRRLCLAGNRIEDEGACAIATVLRVVSLAATEGGGEDGTVGAAGGGGGGGGGGAAGLPATSASSLETLDLQRTWLADRGLIALGVALRLNTTLRVLLLHDNFFTDQGGEAFAALVEENRSLVRCQLGSTSVPYPIVARVQRAMERNRRALERREQDELQREVIALHYQNYKLEEARHELEGLQDKNSGLKRALDQVDLQCKQDQMEFVKKCNELEEHIKNYTEQAARMKEQRETLEADAKKAAEEFEVEMADAKARLEGEVKQRERVEEEHRRVTAELEYWKYNSKARESAKREQLEQTRKEIREWESQRKGYREQSDAMSSTVRALEERVAALRPSRRKSISRSRKESSQSRSRSKSKLKLKSKSKKKSLRADSKA